MLILILLIAHSEMTNEQPLLNFNFGSPFLAPTQGQQLSENHPTCNKREPISFRKPADLGSNRLLNNTASRLKNLMGISTTPGSSTGPQNVNPPNKIPASGNASAGFSSGRCFKIRQ